MSPKKEGVSPQISRGGGRVGRLAAIGALALVVIAIGYLVLGGGGNGTQYKLIFETGGQLVPDNQVLIGGAPVGTIDDITLRDDGQAEVTITVDRTLHQGTSAVIRQTSLSGIANRYVSITPGPDNAPELDDGALITQVDTTTPVDLDQLFNALGPKERKGLQDIIQGSSTLYAGRAEEANETYRYISPALVATDKLIQELNRDEQVLTNFLVSGSRVVTAVAERRDDLSGLVSNSNKALGAVAARNNELDRALVALPPALRQANTTFFNLRLTLDDLDPLVETAKPATKNLAPFLRQFKKVVGKSVPVFKNLRFAVNKQGKNNDLTDAFGKLPAVQSAAARAADPTVQAMIDSEPTLRFIRPYSPDLWGAVSRLGQITAYYDANGHYARIQPAGQGLFCYDGGASLAAECPAATELLNPIAPGTQFTDYGPFGGPNFKTFHRCPGGAMQPASDASSPFLDGGLLTAGPPFPPGDCNPADVLPGP